jgi:hypothetical protein
VTQTATVFPDGAAVRGLPDDRPDLKAIEDLLRTPLSIRYVEREDSEMPEPPVEDCPGV